MEKEANTIQGIRKRLLAIQHGQPDSGFVEFREQNNKVFLFITSAIGIIMATVFHFLDWLAGSESIVFIIWLRIIVSILFVINLIVALKGPKTRRSYKVHIFIAFYTGTLFTISIACLISPISQVYWIGLTFVLILWLTFIPFGFRTLFLNGLNFILLYALGKLFCSIPFADPYEYIESVIFLFATLLIGSVVAYLHEKDVLRLHKNLKELEKTKSELTETDELLRESELQYRMIFDAAGDAIFLVDRVADQIVDANAAACLLYGFTREEFIRMKSRDLQANPEEPVFSYLPSPESFEIPEQLHRKKDGTLFTGEVTGTLYRHGERQLSILVVHDFSVRKRAEEALERTYHHTREQMQSYQSELELKKSELLRLEKENLQSQFEMLKTQINPHFLFNSLNVLTSLIGVNPELAEQFTGQLSKIYRYVLEHKSEDLVSLNTELEFLNAYIFLLDIRFAGKLKVTLDMPSGMEQKKVVPLALQILIENAIKHNTFSIQSPLHVQIFIDRDEYLNVVNNLQKRDVRIESTGLGLANITSRYSFFTNRQPWFGEKDGKFIARIPLLD